MNELNLSELNFEETTQIEGGNIFGDIAIAIDEAIIWFDNLKKVPIF